MRIDDYPRMIEHNGFRRRSRISRIRGFIRRHRVFIIGLILMALVAAAYWHTLTSFAPQAAAIRAKQSEMDSRCAAIESQLIQVSEAVEAMPVVIQETLIPPLADPTPTTAETTIRMRSLGEFKVYAYYRGPNGQLTATGTTCSEGRTVAADFGVLPAGTRIYIEDVGERTVEDCGVSGQTLDLFMADKAACIQWGKQYREVWVIEE